MVHPEIITLKYKVLCTAPGKGGQQAEQASFSSVDVQFERAADRRGFTTGIKLPLFKQYVALYHSIIQYNIQYLCYILYTVSILRPSLFCST